MSLENIEGTNFVQNETTWVEEMDSIVTSIDQFMTINKLSAHNLSASNEEELLQAGTVEDKDTSFLVTDQYNQPLTEETIETFSEFLRDIQTNLIKCKLYTDPNQESSLLIIHPVIH